MPTFLRRFAACLLLGLAAALPARATPVTIDYSDLWWVGPAEDGWGMNVIQQGEVIFATFFVYGPDRTPRWYAASNLQATGAQPSTGHRFTGELYETTGPWFGGPYSPAASGRVAGTATITFNTPDSATLSYTVDGVAVLKAIVRQTFRANSVAGQYAGGLVAIASNCANSGNNGRVDILGSVTATHSGNNVAFQVDFVSGNGFLSTCLFSGTHQPRGRLGNVASGNFSCVVGGQQANSGTFTMTALDAQRNGFHATFAGADQFCTYNGRFGGTREAGT